MIPQAEPVTRFATVSLRGAAWSDVHKVWRWNNARDVRELALQRQPIAVTAHQNWYSARLCERGHYMWIVVADGVDVGVIRVAISEVGAPIEEAIISIALGSEARGRGVGRRALEAACQRIAALRPRQVLEAWIAPANVASARCFESCDFRWNRSEDRDQRPFNVYRLEVR